MAKKKWKKRLKKIAKAALIGGALYAGSKLLKGRRKGSVAADVDSGRAGDSASAIARSVANAAPIRKDVMPISKKKPADDSWLDVPKGPHGAGGKAEMWRRIKDAQYEKGEHYTPNLNPYTPPKPNRFGRAVSKKGGRIGAKKGGSVTGAAKRGFGRALMKGKK